MSCLWSLMITQTCFTHSVQPPHLLALSSFQPLTSHISINHQHHPTVITPQYHLSTHTAQHCTHITPLHIAQHCTDGGLLFQ